MQAWVKCWVPMCVACSFGRGMEMRRAAQTVAAWGAATGCGGLRKVECPHRTRACTRHSHITCPLHVRRHGAGAAATGGARGGRGHPGADARGGCSGVQLGHRWALCCLGGATQTFCQTPELELTQGGGSGIQQSRRQTLHRPCLVFEKSFIFSCWSHSVSVVWSPKGMSFYVQSSLAGGALVAFTHYLQG